MIMLLRFTMSAIAVLSISCASVSAAETGECVAYRAKEWKSLHVENVANTERTIEILKKLGCETKLNQHGDHTDITFRSVEWKEITLETHENADRWEQWFAKNGFETVHGHDHAAGTDAIVVGFHQVEWQSQHFDDERRAAEFAAICKGLGCEIGQNAHAGHFDVSYRCVSPRNLVCIDDEDAHTMQAWLEKKGFKTEHDH